MSRDDEDVLTMTVAAAAVVAVIASVGYFVVAATALNVVGRGLDRAASAEVDLRDGAEQD